MRKRKSLEAFKEDYNKKLVEFEKQRSELEELKNAIDSFRKNEASDRLVKLELSDTEYDELLAFLSQDKRKILNVLRAFAEEKSIKNVSANTSQQLHSHTSAIRETAVSEQVHVSSQVHAAAYNPPLPVGELKNVLN